MLENGMGENPTCACSTHMHYSYDADGHVAQRASMPTCVTLAWEMQEIFVLPEMKGETRHSKRGGRRNMLVLVESFQAIQNPNILFLLGGSISTSTPGGWKMFSEPAGGASPCSGSPTTSMCFTLGPRYPMEEYGR